MCRVLIAAVAITYLMCVLLLSGMQKEDLDINMLTKLERHNVNIEDMNNAELLQACVQSRDNNSDDKVTNITETRPYNKIKNPLIKDIQKTGEPAVLKSSSTENDSYNASTLYKIRNDFLKDDNEASNQNAYIHNKTVNEVSQNNDGQPELERLRHDMVINKVNGQLIQIPDSITEQESKRSVTVNIHSSESDTLSSLLAKFLSRRSLSIKATTTQKTVNVDDAVEKLYLMRIQDMEKITNGNSGLNRRFSMQQNALKSQIKKEIIDIESKSKGENTNIMNHTNSRAAFIINKFENINPFGPDAEIVNINRKNKESLNVPRNPYLLPNVQRIDTAGAANKELKYNISRDMIKEIADSVKEIILRDLRKELHGTTTVSTNATTLMSTTTVQSKTLRESEYVTILQKEKPKKLDSVMSKFFELFEEIKSLKPNTEVIQSETEEGINNKETNQNVNIKEFNVYPHRTMPALIPTNIIQAKLPYHTNQVHGMKPYATVNSENIFNFAPQLHKYRSEGFINNQPTITKPPLITKQEPNNALLPLTVQTNNIEIPPLHIPLDKSQNLIRQNIIVTTRAPYRIALFKNGKSGASKIGYQHRDSPHLEKSKNFEPYIPKHLNTHLSDKPYRPPSHNFHSNDNEDVIRFTLNNNEHSKYNANYYERINLGKYKPQTNSHETIHQETPRFHEKLEKIERNLDYPERNKYIERNDCCDENLGYSEAMIDCCNRKIASRHQMSLNHMKKKSYDDGHFQKFLQSQQKVTDMLEKILGDKVNVQSVETA